MFGRAFRDHVEVPSALPVVCVSYLQTNSHAAEIKTL
jgi:hypothetical protein